MRTTLALAALALALLALPALPVSADVTGITGGSQPQPTIQPSLGVQYIVRVGGTDRLGDIQLFAGSLIPGGWLPANGQLLSIASYPNLFNITGTAFGGDGNANFALPDLRSRVPIGAGAGPGLTPYNIGDALGVEQVTLTTAQLPSHTHTLPPPNTLTSATGSGLPYTNLQPSAAVNFMIAREGIFPSQDGGGFGFNTPALAQVVLTTRSTAPNGWSLANGQLLAINQDTALFSLLGTTYGGNGVNTFQLPDLRGRAAIHAGSAPGLSTYNLGETTGTESLTLSTAQLPAHTHTLPGGGITNPTGSNIPQTNLQPSLALNYIIALNGIYPNADNDTGDDSPILGEIELFAGTFVPKGWAFANGQLLAISQNTALFSLLGTTFGGNGINTFGLPNLQGRLAIEAGQGPGLSPWTPGDTRGTESNTLTINQMPAHTHNFTPIPEPASLPLLLAPALTLLLRRRRTN